MDSLPSIVQIRNAISTSQEPASQEPTPRQSISEEEPSPPGIESIAMIGCGSMGGGMALLFAEHGLTVYVEDPSEENLKSLLDSAEKEGLSQKIKKCANYAEICQSLNTPRVFILSLPHGKVGDTVVDDLRPYLDPGDIIVDASNENWQTTQQRQGKLVTQNVHYVGMGVSGGYQAARRGPSMCPGGDERALEMILPLLEKVCARDKQGRACVGKVGAGGSGHYVKMVHNGIEQGMMSVIAEAFHVMNVSLGMSYDEIGDEFERWNANGELKNTFLVDIGADICRKKDENGESVLARVQDKVVQDTDESEGTGIWTNVEAIRLHIPAPSIATAHFLRLASADRAERVRANKISGGSQPLNHITQDRKEFLEDLRMAVYGSCLASYIQGLIVIDKADRQNHWRIDFAIVTQIWRAGCIIQADYIADIMEEVYKEHGRHKPRNPLYISKFEEELTKAYPPSKRVVLKSIEANAVIPCLSASLEYLKYIDNTDLPTDFYEAELDYFGNHKFDLKSESPGEPKTGSHHFEWKPA